ncbi:hypothetical protein MKA37_06760 [[Clostridium] innocuum]|nr:hypothetical protein [[Clostridium] innocuum]
MKKMKPQRLTRGLMLLMIGLLAFPTSSFQEIAIDRSTIEAQSTRYSSNQATTRGRISDLTVEEGTIAYLTPEISVLWLQSGTGATVMRTSNVLPTGTFAQCDNGMQALKEKLPNGLVEKMEIRTPTAQEFAILGKAGFASVENVWGTPITANQREQWKGGGKVSPPSRTESRPKDQNTCENAAKTENAGWEVAKRTVTNSKTFSVITGYPNPRIVQQTIPKWDSRYDCGNGVSANQITSFFEGKGLKCRGGVDYTQCKGLQITMQCRAPAGGYQIGDVDRAWASHTVVTNRLDGYKYVKDVSGDPLVTPVTKKCETTFSADTATIRPIVTINRGSIIFASSSSTGVRTASSTLEPMNGRFTTNLQSSESGGYKFIVENSAMKVSDVQTKEGDTSVYKQIGNKIAIKKGTKSLTLNVGATGSGAAAPNGVSALSTSKTGEEMFGTLASISGAGNNEVTIDLENLMDVETGGSKKTISLYAEQQNGPQNTDYISAPYDIEVFVVDGEQELALKKDTVMNGYEYGTDFTVTAIVNEDKENRKFDAEKEMVATIAEGYEEFATVKSSTWNATTGETTIVIHPLKSGKVKLNLHKDENWDKGFIVSSGDVKTAEIDIGKRNVTLQPKKQTQVKNELFVDPVIESHYPGDAAKPGLVNDDALPESITVKTTNSATSTVEDIPSRTLSGNKRFTTIGIWTQSVDFEEYNKNKTLDEKYVFTGAENDYEVKDAFTPDDTYIDISPVCKYKDDDKDCWNSGTVTVKPSEKAKAEGYDLIKNTTKAEDQIETNEDNFASEFTITGPARTAIEDIKYNLKNSTKNSLTNQDTIDRSIRIDETEPAKINAKGEKVETPSVTALLSLAEAAIKESVEAAGGDAGGIRFDSSPIQLTISAEDEQSGIRFVKAYQEDGTGAVGSEIALTEKTAENLENEAVPGSDNSIDSKKTYKKKVYTALLPTSYKGKVKIVATNNAGLESYKTTNFIVHETADEADMVVEAGASAVKNADGTYQPGLSDGADRTNVKWPLKIQAPKSGIKSIKYYITDESNLVNWKGSSISPIDVTSEYKIKTLSENLNWDNVNDNLLDTEEHDEAVVPLKEAIAEAQKAGKTILHVHAKLESNAGNIKEEVYSIKVMSQGIEFNQDIQDANVAGPDETIMVEAIYGTPIDITAQMVDASENWAATGDFTFEMSDADKKFVKLSDTTQEAFQTSKNTTGTDKGKATLTLTPLTGNDQEVTLKVKKAGDAEYMESNELTLKIKLKSKKIDITADSATTYDVRTGEKHPTLTWEITDRDSTSDGLVKDPTAGIDDTTDAKKVDFLLKATTCVDGATCGIDDLTSYTQDSQRINETGEWKLVFTYNKDNTSGTSKEAEFNRKYDIKFIDAKDSVNGSDKKLIVTQDSVLESWYTITPDPETDVASDKDAWNKSEVKIEPTSNAITGSADTKDLRTYDTVTNDVKIKASKSDKPEDWGWDSSFTRTKNDGADAKEYEMRFRDSKTGAFTNVIKAKRTVRVDEDDPSTINFKTEAVQNVSPAVSLMADIVDALGGDATGIRFANQKIKLTIDAEDTRSGIREVKAYKVNADGSQGTEIVLNYQDSESTKNTAVDAPTDGTETYSNKVYTAELDDSFNSKILIVAMDNAGNKAKKTTNRIVLEKSSEKGMLLEAGAGAPKDDANEFIVGNSYVNGNTETLWPLKVQAEHSGIKKITYYITDTEGNELSGKADAQLNVTGTGEGTFGITELPNTVDWEKADDASLVTEVKEKGVVSLKEAVQKMKGKANAVIQVHAKLESNAGNILEEVFSIHIDNQQIDWSDDVKNKGTIIDDVLTLEATYGTPIDISAEMIQDSKGWASDSDFVFKLADGDDAYAHLSSVTHSGLSTTGNPTTTANGKGKITLTPLTGNDKEVTLKVKKASNDTYVESNEITLKVKLKSKKIDITADPVTTYDVKTGEKHPKLTWKITDRDQETGGLVKDTDAAIDDKEVDYLLKATTCATGATCGIDDLTFYTQDSDRINKTGEWNLEFKYDKTVVDGDSAEAVFNRKYDINFIDSKTADKGADKTLKVTQDSFTEDWYTITPDPENKVKTDTDAWNKSTVTVKPTNDAKTGTDNVRTYSTITNDVEEAKGTATDSTSWGWTTEFTHDKDEDTSAKKYALRFRDPVTGAFTDTADAKRTVRVDEDAPSDINFKTKVVDDASPAISLMADIVEAVGGNADGIRFANKATELTIDASDPRSGIREVKAYKVNADGSQGEEIVLTYKQDQSTVNAGITGPGSTADGSSTYSKKVYTAELGSAFNSKVLIIATDNADNEAKKTTNTIVIEKSDATEMVLEAGAAAPKTGTNYTVNNAYVNGTTETLWPMKIKAPHSGIKKITYYITDTKGTALDGTAAAPIDVTGTGKYGIDVLPNTVAWETAEDKALDIVEHDKGVVSLKSAYNQMKGKDDAVIQVHARLESNAGNVKEETFAIHFNNQQITWSDAVKALDTDTSDDAITLEATYGTPIDISAEMIQASTGWSATSNFVYALADGDDAYANIEVHGTTHSDMTTTGNPDGTAKGKAGITLIPLTGNDTIVTLKVKKESDDEYAESNELTLTVKLKSKKIDITADPVTTYDVKTGEKHPKLTWKITDRDQETGGLVKDTDVAIDDKEVDYLLKATTCATGATCGIDDLTSYTQDSDRINKTGEWKLEFKYDKTVVDGDSAEAVFNRKYDINFIDSKTADKGADKILKVTQDSFTEDWYTITPDLENLVKKDSEAWNGSTVTMKPTDKATTGSAEANNVRTYSKIINTDVEKKGNADKPETWDWTDDFTHDKDAGTSPKKYELRFRDPVTGAFTGSANAKRSVRVDESAPVKPFISVNDSNIPASIPDAGSVQGKRFSKDGLNITTSVVDEESGIRSLTIYKVDKDGNTTEITDATLSDENSTVPGVEEGTFAVKKKTATFLINDEFKGSIRIVAVNNAGKTTTLETMQLINEPSDKPKITVVKDETETEKVPEKITRENYDKTYIYPMKIEAPVSGIKQITYTMQVDDCEETVTTLLKNTGDITTPLGVESIDNQAVIKGTTEKTPIYTLDKDAVNYDTYFPIQAYIDEMVDNKVEVGTIRIKMEVESNAGNKVTQEFELPVDLLLNDAASYIITPKRIQLKNTVDGKEAVGSDKLELITVKEEDKPAGQDITQYFNVYTPHEITLNNAESKTGETYVVSVFDEAGKKLTSDKNLLASLIYDAKTEAGFTLKTPIVTNPEKEKYRGEYDGLMTYTVKYGKKDEGKQP